MGSMIDGQTPGISIDNDPPEQKKKRYYSVQVTQRMEVCVLATDEGEAEDIARQGDFDWGMADIEDADAEEAYNDPEDEHFVQEFKDEQKYAE